MSLYLVGCASYSNPKGNYTPLLANFDKDYQAIVAQDFTKQLLNFYNPADTTFIITHQKQDYFGLALIDNLRLQGYAVQQGFDHDIYQNTFTPYQTQDEKTQNKLEFERAKQNPYRHTLKYAVIPLEQNLNTADELYSVTLYIDKNRRLSSLWQVRFDHLTKKTHLQSASLWTWRN